MADVLVVDDDEGFLESIEGLASAAGIRVATATSWQDGLNRFVAMSPQLVIADYNIPGERRGLTLLLEMSQLRPSVRFVLVSAYLNDQDLVEVLKFPFIGAAYRKVDPTGTARALLQEMRDSATRGEGPTDWTALAKATLRTSAIDQAQVDALDLYLRDNRIGRSG